MPRTGEDEESKSERGPLPGAEGAFFLMSIEEAKILVVGAGGLGSAAAAALAQTGVGTIGLADPDRVELSNLHRQLLHTSADVGALKVDSIARKLGRVVRTH